MDLLFRLNRKTEGFENLENANYFFQYTLPEIEGNYFNDTVRRSSKLQEGDQIYFTYNNYIIAKAVFCGEIKESKSDPPYFYGHKVRAIQILDAQEEINHMIFGTRTTYIDSDLKKQELNRLLNLTSTENYPDEIDENTQKSIIEGGKKRVVVNAYERDPKARQLCIDKYGYNCRVCGLNFENKYGEIGKNFIHVHHLKPLSDLKDEYEVNPREDLKPVCPNCHAMLHKKKPPYGIEELKKLITSG